MDTPAPVARPFPSGDASGFPATRWSLVAAAGQGGTEALSQLLGRYRTPLIRFAEREGVENPEAAVDAFITTLLRRNGLARVSPEKGRFRTWLLACLKNHLRDEWKKRQTQRRGGGAPHQSLDEEPPEGTAPLQVAGKGRSPDEAFDRAWAEAVIAEAWRRLEEKRQAAGRGDLFNRIRPVLAGDPDAPAYEAIAAEAGVSVSAIKMEVQRRRQQLSELIRSEVAETVGTMADVDEELSYLINLFSR